MENNTLDTSNTPDTTITTRRNECETASQNRQMMYQLEVKSKKNKLRSAKVLKTANENTTK